MRESDNITALSQLDIDWIGMIYYHKTPRNVEQNLDSASFNGRDRVGVFVDESLAGIKEKSFRYGLNMIQLHGNESPGFCEEVRRLRLKVIKALPIIEKEDLDSICDYEGKVDYLLLDAKSKLRGGSGKKFDWSILKNYNADIPFLLSGGIGPEDVQAISKVDHPNMAGVDLNSRFEVSPGVKNIELIEKFVKELRKEIHEV